MPQVYPVSYNTFRIGLNGRASTEEQMVIIKGMENFAPGIDSNVEEYTSMEDEGWTSRVVTGKGMTFGFSGKRVYGDPGNDYVASTMLGIGPTAETRMDWTFPDGTLMEMDVVLSITTPGGGDSTAIDSLEFDAMTHGKPVMTAAGAKLTFVTVDGSAAGKTAIDVVAPVAVGTYYVGVNVAKPVIGLATASLGTGFSAYTLGADITAAENATVVLVEVSGGFVTKVGSAHANSQEA
jgi:hypothetical protein